MAEEAVRQETVTSNIPDWAKPYAERLLGRAQALTEPVYDPGTGLYKPRFTPYAGQLVAGLSPLQEQAMLDLAGMQVSPQTLQASGLAGLVGQRAGEVGRYQPISDRNYFTDVTPGEVDIGYSQVQAPERTGYQMQGPERVGAGPLTMYQMQGPERVGAERFGLGAMQEYMSPYMQGVVQQQKRAATQDYLRQLPGLGAAAARAGAKGGTRESLLQAEAQRGLQERLGDIEASGLQQAYQQAASQFGQDRAAQMQAALANQQAGLTAGGQNLAAALGIQQLGAGQSMQAQLANQAAQQQAAQQNLQSQIQQAQFAAQQAMQAGQTNQAAQLQAQAQRLQQQQSVNQMRQQGAQLGAQYGLAGAQLGEQSRQFGAGLGLQGLAQQLAAAQALGGLGQQQFQQQTGITSAQLGAGAQAQALAQQRLAAQYQQFMEEQQAPYKQLEFMSGILRGTPATAGTTSFYQQPPSTLSMIAGLSGGLGGLFGNLGG
jgi:hypothetical protein